MSECVSLGMYTYTHIFPSYVHWKGQWTQRPWDSDHTHHPGLGYQTPNSTERNQSSLGNGEEEKYKMNLEHPSARELGSEQRMQGHSEKRQKAKLKGLPVGKCGIIWTSKSLMLVTDNNPLNKIRTQESILTSVTEWCKNGKLFLPTECQLAAVERRVTVEHHGLAATTVRIRSSRKHEGKPKPAEEGGEGPCKVSKYLPTKHLLNTKVRKGILQWRNLACAILIKWISYYHQSWDREYQVPPARMQERGHSRWAVHFWV